MASQNRPDNLAEFYEWRINTAVQLELEKKYDEGLAIIWDLRRQPDLGLLHRALVNLYISMFADPDVHDLAAFARECLAIIQTLRDEGINGGIIPNLESRANARLVDLQNQISDEPESADGEECTRSDAAEGEDHNNEQDNLHDMDENERTDMEDTDDDENEHEEDDEDTEWYTSTSYYPLQKQAVGRQVQSDMSSSTSAAATVMPSGGDLHIPPIAHT